MGLPDDRQQRTVNIVHIGLFNREFAAQDIAHRLAVAEDEDFDVAPRIDGKGSWPPFA